MELQEYDTADLTVEKLKVLLYDEYKVKTQVELNIAQMEQVLAMKLAQQEKEVEEKVEVKVEEDTSAEE